MNVCLSIASESLKCALFHRTHEWEMWPLFHKVHKISYQSLIFTSYPLVHSIFQTFFFFLSFFSPLRNLQVSKFSIHMEVKNQLQAYITKYVHDNNYNKNCSNDSHWENSLTEDRGKQSRRWYTCKGLHTTVSRFTKVACSVYHWDLRHPGLESTKYRQHDWILPKGTT